MIFHTIISPSFTLDEQIFLEDVILKVVSLAYIFLVEQEFKIHHLFQN